MSITLTHPTGIVKGRIELPLSKSESNRILILQALSGGKVKVEIDGLSDARDTKILQSALASEEIEINVEDAGTAMRFLTAYYCATNQHKIVTGSARMQERPIGILVDALREIGFDIRYLKTEGCPPLEINPVNLSTIKNEVNIAGNVSSQYISAIAMIAPVLEHGLKINFTTALASAPYIGMTMELLYDMGIKSKWEDNHLDINHQDFKEANKKAYGDWSAASYWFSMAGLASEAEIWQDKLSGETHQGDAVMATWMTQFGVYMKAHDRSTAIYKATDEKPASEFHLIYPDGEGGLTAHRHRSAADNAELHYDFTHHPDLAQTMIVFCAAKNIRATFSGLASLRIKETDRIAALQSELSKFGVKLYEFGKGVFGLEGTFAMSHQIIKTYNDHRMAMAFAPLALLGKITIEHPEVVAKSYPSFWVELEKAGFLISPNIPL